MPAGPARPGRGPRATACRRGRRPCTSRRRGSTVGRDCACRVGPDRLDVRRRGAWAARGAGSESGRRPPSTGWQWASWKPGRSVRPTRSSRRVSRPDELARPRDRCPTATIRPARTATAAAVRRAASIVMTAPPTRTRSARPVHRRVIAYVCSRGRRSRRPPADCRSGSVGRQHLVHELGLDAGPPVPGGLDEVPDECRRRRR